MLYIRFWVHWLAEHAPKSVKYQFTKPGVVTSRDTKEGAKIISKWHFPTRWQVFKKKQSTIKRRKTAKMPYIWFWVHWLAEHAPNSDQYQFTKLGLLAATDPKEGTKITWKLIFLIGRGVLIKIQRALFNTKNGRKWLIFDSGCTGWQSMLRNPLMIDLPNLFGWLEVTLRK